MTPPPLWNFSKNSSGLVAGPFPNLGISNRINISIAIKYQVLSILKSHSHIDQVLLGILPYLLSSRVGGYVGQLWIFWRREVSGRHTKCTPSFLTIPTFALCQNPAHHCHQLYSILSSFVLKMDHSSGLKSQTSWNWYFRYNRYKFCDENFC